MRILLVASEAFPIVKTGGLADVVGALPRGLAAHGVTARLLLPAYRGTAERVAVDRTGSIALGDLLGVGHASLLPFEHADAGLRGWLLECPALFDRPGGPYLDERGHDHHDNHLRFGLLSRTAALLATLEGLTGFAVDVVHSHDWQAGLVSAYFEAFGGRRPSTVFTAHNLHFAGRFDASVLPEVGLPASMQRVDGVELWGSMSFLKAGLFFADRITTFSPTYAREIQTEAGGEGLHGLLHTRREALSGILNGIDDQAWNPARDAALAQTYDAGDSLLAGKAACKADLQRQLGLDLTPAAPMVGMVGRLTGQKGVDLLLSALPQLLSTGGQLAVLGSGEPALQLALHSAAAHHPGRVAFVQGYDEALSHRLIAGVDLLAVPSRFEPCGLTQMYAQRYGTPPIVRRTGGLADTVLDADAHPDAGTGFSFEAPSTDSLLDALMRAVSCYRDRPRLQAVQRRAMSLTRGWTKAAKPYAELYRDLLGVGSRTV